ncbi:MAG: cytidine deaminase [Bdellovibrionaceae bacterium]|nr:cytidine deaminase [Pseudobdellovibrionaceae bacterium]|tara:strand:+ start:1008 stop:1427 length:420 start_codon:yes stop_codon:yes gene_type:complete
MSYDPELYEAAKKIWKNSHSPYSKVQVASAVRTEDGKIYVGINVENASYGATVCAERVAIWNAATYGNRKIKEIVIYTTFSPPLAPCGMCRQVMSEFISAEDADQIKVTTLNDRGEAITHSFAELLPMSLAPERVLNLK